jgi:hypothetical protein
MDRKDQYQPPLVTTLFSPNYFEILNTYPVARHAGSEIRRAITLASQASDSFAVERFIRETYEDATNPDDKRKALALPWYLQELLWTASDEYTKNPDNYDVLVSQALRLGDVIFVTLNYDTILDDVLSTYAPLTSIQSYVDHGRGWSLIKLHGSVNWGRRIQDREFNESYIYNPPADLRKVVKRDIELRPRRPGLDRLRRDSASPRYPAQWYYPALSVPVGGDEDLLNVPASHKAFLRRQLADADAVDVLVIGYSANDEEVLSLLAEKPGSVASCCVVCDTQANAIDAYARMAAKVPIPSQSARARGGGFSGFAQGSRIEDFFDQVRRARG